MLSICKMSTRDELIPTSMGPSLGITPELYLASIIPSTLLLPPTIQLHITTIQGSLLLSKSTPAGGDSLKREN